MTVSITDTSSRAHAVQFEVLRGMPGEKRLLMALEMSLFARELAKEGIRRDHPEWAETQVARELLRLAFLPEPLPAQLL
ncbi:MAG: hypothetical protein DMG80_12340 [Acidobacteria bacterium]|nr:MAG: hypothetical protein DMG80_12340 [Acidobacteriota bacterium]